MKKINYCIKSIGLVKFFCFLYIIGIVFGVIFVSVFRENLISEVSNFILYFHSNLNSITIDKFQLWKLVLVERYKSYCMLLFFSVTAFGIPYILGSIIYQGFKVGFLLGIFILQYGGKGFFIFLSFGFPQSIIYLPVMLVALIRGYSLCKSLYYHPQQMKEHKKKRIVDSLPLFLLLAVALLLGGILEAYVNTDIIRKVG